MRLVFMGTPEFSVPILSHLSQGGYQVVAVYTQPDTPSGRGLRLSPSPVKRAALALGLPVATPATLKDERVLRELARFAPEVIVVAAYGKILPNRVLNLPEHGCLNIHPSLLPRHRGATPIPAAILAGDATTGVTVMLMDRGLDTGPILAQVELPIADSDTTGTLTVKLSELASQLIIETLPCWVKKEIRPAPQNEGKATYSGQITRASGEIDWNLPALQLWRQVRAYNPWPGAYTRWREKELKITRAVLMPPARGIEAGRVAADSFPEGVGFGVGTGDGILGIQEVQFAGRRAMPAADFLRGQRDFTGARLPC
ncbi:MAG: methionyl-tRNA formyltransferase [Chloroflexota bacterium]